MVEYKYKDGWHVFTSKILPGLYVASQDLNKAIKDIPLAVKKLRELNA